PRRRARLAALQVRELQPSHLPPDRAAARGPPAHPGRGDRADRAALRREEPPRPGALLLPGEPDPPPLPPPRAPVRERAHDAGHLLEHHRARLPERRLSDPARDDAGGDGTTAAPPARPPAPAHAPAVPDRLPAPAALDHHATRLRPLALLRDHQAQSGRGDALRLSSHPVGGQRGTGRGRLAVRLLSARSWRRGPTAAQPEVRPHRRARHATDILSAGPAGP